MGKQLLILMSLLAGGSPASPKEDAPSEELISSCFECMDALFQCMGRADSRIFDETGAKTVVDQCVYLLLEAITDNPSENVRLSAVKALQSLHAQISSRVLLASLLPRTVSALTQTLKPSTQVRRTHRVLVAVLQLLETTLRAVLADSVAINTSTWQTEGRDLVMRESEASEDSTILDDKWLKATASQVKLALANVVKLRNHARPEVRNALFQMCLMICEECSKTLSESLQLAIETMTILANQDETSPVKSEMTTLRHLVLSNAELAEILSNSFDAWINALPRVMQGIDDRPKRQILRQLATAFQLLLDSDQASDLLDDLLAANLVDSVSAAVEVASKKPIQAVSEPPSSLQLTKLEEMVQVDSFEPVLLEHNSQSESLSELQTLITQIRQSGAREPLTRSIMSRIDQASGNQQLSALWLTLCLLKQEGKPQLSMSDLVELPESYDTAPYLISDVYSITLPYLLESSNPSSSIDWRLSALALESTILQASQLGQSYRPELIDTLYPILSMLGHTEPRLRSQAITALNLLARSCEYPNTAMMLVENVDYLINSIALKLNTFDISPQGPQVLLMMLRLCGARLIPYLDDLIGSIFAALDNFHGYPRLVQLLFEVLSVVVDEAARDPALAITDGKEEPRHRKIAHRPSMLEDILEDIRAHRRRRERREAGDDDYDPRQSAPQRPWNSKLDGPQERKGDYDDEDGELKENEDAGSNQAIEEKEKPLSKPHNLLLSIARSAIPHLSSPSPSVRLTLLQLLTRVSPVLARDENSFLPLINDIWPAILPRLFSIESRNTIAEGQEPDDPVYVNVAAADTISAICGGAGDFMSSRIEDIFPRLEKLYTKVWAEVEKDRERMTQHRGPTSRLAIDNNQNSEDGNLKGTVDLQIVKQSPITSQDKILTPASAPGQSTSSSSTSPRTSTTLLHNALASLLTTIIAHVRITDDIGDRILALLAPIMDDPGREEVRDALEIWNADAVWALRETMEIQKEMLEQKRVLGDWTWRGRAKPEAFTDRHGRRVEFPGVVF
jgi:TELO2-interacting protein 1